MTKCSCVIGSGFSSGQAPETLMELGEQQTVNFPTKCVECGEEVLSEDDCFIFSQSPETCWVVCKVCWEVIMCFICSGNFGEGWELIERAVLNDRLPLGNLGEVLSKPALDKFVAKADEWIEQKNKEDEKKEK